MSRLSRKNTVVLAYTVPLPRYVLFRGRGGEYLPGSVPASGRPMRYACIFFFILPRTPGFAGDRMLSVDGTFFASNRHACLPPSSRIPSTTLAAAREYPNSVKIQHSPPIRPSCIYAAASVVEGIGDRRAGACLVKSI